MVSRRVPTLPIFLALACLALSPSALAQPSLCEAVDNCTLTWNTGGDVPWFGQADVTTDDVDAAQSGDIEDDQSSVMETTVTGPATVMFFWRVSSELDCDYLQFHDNGSLVSEISGEEDWSLVTRELAAGEHILKFTYFKDGSVSEGTDAGYVDRFIVEGVGEGSVQVNLGPQAAIDDGAQWNLDGGEWRNSGDVLSGILAGLHTVHFKPAGIWASPATRQILVAPGESLTLSGEYILLCDGVDACHLNWTTSGDALWNLEAGDTHDTVDAVRSGDINDDESSLMSTTVNGPATVAFWWRVSSEIGYDYLQFRVNDSVISEITGEAGWAEIRTAIEAGPQTLTWEYYKDSSESEGEDAGFVDEVAVMGADPGALTVDIVPAEAVALGAQWSIDGGATWNDSGAVLDPLPADFYTITFQNIGDPWNQPPDREVAVSSGVTREVAATYYRLCEGVGACNREWTTSGDGGWLVQQAVNHDGHNACQSGEISDNRYSVMETTVTGPVTISFWWKTSCEETFDTMTFEIDYGADETSPRPLITGVTDWEQQIIALSPGPHILTWTYQKDSWGSQGMDCGWVDQFLVVETDPPTGSVLVNGGARYAGAPDVLLDLSWDDGDGSGVIGVRFSNNGATWSPWRKPLPQVPWSVVPGDGLRMVRAQFRDKAGNVSDRYSDSILLDTTPPTGGILINDGAASTGDPAVTLSLAWADGAGSGVTRMRFSNNGATWSAWEPVAATRAWTLPAGTGLYRTVRVQYLDRAGNASERFYDYIYVTGS